MSAISALVLLALSATGNALCATGSDTVLVQFHSTNCGPCRAMHPVVQRLAGEGYPLQQIDVDQQPEYAKQFQIRSLPTFVLFARGREAQRVEGSSSFDELANMFRTVGYRPTVGQQKSAPQETQFTSTPAANPSATASPPQLRPTPATSPQQRAAWATVRLKIEDERGFGFGTGTIIDRHDEEALVMTCGHLFRQSQGKGKILVDLFAPGAQQPIEGQLIAFDLDRDIALVSIRLNIKIEPVPVAPADYAVAPRDRVFSIGCDKGAAPSLQASHLTAVNKYQGAPNFTVAGAPVDGRSGGGLFTENGQLIGVCNAADAKDNEGLYAALASVHWQLDQIGQSAIYRGQVKPATPLIATESPPTIQRAAAEQPLVAPSRSMPPTMPNQMPAVLGQRATTADYIAPIPAAADDTEVIVIVRSRSNPARQSEIFVMDRPPAEIIRQLQAQARPATRGTSQDLLRSAGRLDQTGAPIVRGQSQE